MGIFVLIAVVAVIVVLQSAEYLKRKKPNSRTYLLPGFFLTVLSFILMIVSYFTSSDGWNIMGYFFLFIFVSIASFIGTIVGRKFGMEEE
ncbi:hypothetical protein MHI18_08980 [Peribacillus sp. FSL H8-0477]|uniref:hypothetical protein n=1 Tax=Peribacillus sp. FSL H8-0477 TaxID=2921388 RepID=UPI0030F55113